MRRSRITALVLISALITGKVAVTQPRDETGLQGDWLIESIQRSGSFDFRPLDHQLTFRGNVVQFVTAGFSMVSSGTIVDDSLVPVFKLEPPDPAKIRALMLS